MKGPVPASLAALALLACVSVAGAAGEISNGPSGARPIVNGKLAYSSSGRPSKLYAVNQDGSGRRILARCRSLECQIGGYAWSPSGKRLAFLRGVKGGNLSLFVVRADGTLEKRLPGCGRPKWPTCSIRTFFGRLSWSPDGSRLVVARGESLFIVKFDRSGFRRVTRCGPAGSCVDTDPSWAPRGARIVFVRSGSIYSVKTDGSGLARLTNLPGLAHDPAWSPDGSRIAFEVSGAAVGDKIYSMAADGSELTVLSTGPSGSGPGRPSWSPDGTRVLFFKTPGNPGEYTPEVWVVKADGGEPRRLYQGPCCVGTWAAPIWSPDGRYVAFGVGSLYPDQFPKGIFVMTADGAPLHRLTTDVAEVAWQRKPSQNRELRREPSAVKGS
jgi:Tol biopolymer transport system component